MPSDRDAVRRIACDTADCGESVESFFGDRELAADLLTGYYIECEPGSLWVAERRGRVVAYLAGCLDSRRFPRAMVRRLPRLLLKALLRGALWRRDLWRMAAAALRRRRGDEGHGTLPLARFPAHLHINVERGQRGCGLGRILVEHFCAQASITGVRGVQVSVRSDSAGGRGFFEALGFAEIARRPRAHPVARGEAPVSSVIYGKELLPAAGPAGPAVSPKPRRRRRWAMGCFAAVLLSGGIFAGWWYAGAAVVSGGEYPQLVLGSGDRILVLAPHPDDEVIGCGGVIQRAAAAKLPLRIAFLTNGDDNKMALLAYYRRPTVNPRGARAMGLVRCGEARAAALELSVAEKQLVFLGYPDGRALHIWRAHWGDSPPAEGPLTEAIGVPYPGALRPGAAYKGEDVLRDIKTVLRGMRPTKVFVSHPADGHADHRALYLFTRVALWDLESQMRPTLHPYLVHWRRWPNPRGYHPERFMEPPRKLAGWITWREHRLIPAEVETKRAALESHRSQLAVSGKYLRSFVRASELFGDYAPIALGPDFVEVSERFMRMEGNDLVVAVKLSRPLAGTARVSLYAFGWRADRPFAKMPKLHIRCGSGGEEVSDGGRKLQAGAVKITRAGKRLTIRVPLKELGDPRRILTSVRTSVGGVTLDSGAWRVLQLPAKEDE
jgi:LmbE family N-acetylglucosaminyl deacetylase/GNAT superfamily N-acetyltransferase